jgi:hypothetical protein
MTAPHYAFVGKSADDIAMILIARLWYVRLGVCAAAISAALGDRHTDAERAAVVHDQIDRIPLRGRQIYMRKACAWLAMSFDAASVGDVAESGRCTDRAAAELERYTREPEGGGA